MQQIKDLENYCMQYSCFSTIIWKYWKKLFFVFCFSNRRKVQEINWQRKQEQTKAGETLTHLEEEWVTLVGKNYEIEQAILELEQELHAAGIQTDDTSEQGNWSYQKY